MKIIRPAQLTDLPQLLELEQCSFTDPWPTTVFSEQLLDPLTFYFIGYDTATPEQIQAYAGYWLCAPEAELVHIATAPAARRQGWGRAMLTHLLADGLRRGVATMFLEVRPENIGAQKLYEQFGFIRCGLRRHYYGQNQHAFLYSLNTQ